MLKLICNVGRLKAGAVIPEDYLSPVLAAQLLADGGAERVDVEIGVDPAAPETPWSRALNVVFDIGDRFASAIDLLPLAVERAGDLDDDERQRLAEALRQALSYRAPWLSAAVQALLTLGLEDVPAPTEAEIETLIQAVAPAPPAADPAAEATDAAPPPDAETRPPVEAPSGDAETPPPAPSAEQAPEAAASGNPKPSRGRKAAG